VVVGIGAMLHYLGGGSEKSSEEYVGREIVSAELIKAGRDGQDALVIKFSDGAGIRLYDDGQSCCEHRYMTTDDDLSTLVGHKLVHIKAKEVSEKEEDYETHEMCFVEVATDGGFVTLTNHNEHNGYYGGFGLSISEITGD